MSTNRIDWQYGLNFKDQFKRFFSFGALELDNNNFGVNTNHVTQGYLTHQIARSSNLNLYETLLFNFISSSFWEYVLEYRENISLNDQAFATFGGFAVGESFYQIGKYLSYHREDNLYGILSWILASPYRLNRLLFKSNRDRHAKEASSMQDVNRRFDFSLGLSNFSNPAGDVSQTNFDISFDFSLLNRRLGEGNFRKPYNRTLLSNLATRLAVFPDESLFFQLKSDITYLGCFRQNLNFRERYLRGSTFLWGISSAFEYQYFRVPDYHYDKYMAADFIGLNFIYSLYARDLLLKLSFSLYGSFVSTQAAALEEYQKHHKLFFAKTVLVYHDYYHALGYTFNSRLLFGFKNLELITKLSYRYADSIEGMDRFQQNITDDFNLIDKRLNWALSVGYYLEQNSIKLFFDLGEWLAWGKAKNIEVKKRVLSSKLGLSFLF